MATDPFLLAGWWRWDDSLILKFCYRYKPDEYLLQPQVWRQFLPGFFTPWLALSYDIDLALFGFNPAGFYFHHILALWGLTAITNIIFRLWYSHLWSFAGSALFLCGAPIVVVSQQLMTRHYIEGLLFALLALYCYTIGIRDQRKVLCYISVIPYLLAITAKEIYIPLFAILPFLSSAPTARHLRYFFIWTAVAAAYLAWRWYMLGFITGGYGAPIVWSSVTLMPQRALSFLFGNDLFGGICILLVISILAIAVFANRANGVAAIVIFLIMIAPLSAVAFSFIGHPTNLAEGRYLLFPWWLLSFMTTAVVAYAAKRPRIATIGLVAVITIGIGSLIQGSRVRAAMIPRVSEWDRTTQFVWRTEQDGYFYAPYSTETSLYVSRLLWLRNVVGTASGELALLADEHELENRKFPDRPIFTYGEDCSCVKDISAQTERLLSEWKGKVQKLPLSMAFIFGPGSVRWEFGPYDGGQYSLSTDFLGGDFAALPLPRTAQRSALVPDRFHARLRYDSPDGWITYSPMLTISTTPRGRFFWGR